MRRSGGLLAAVVLLALAGCQDKVVEDPNLEQKAFDHFLAEYWNPGLFVDECTGLEFRSDVPLRVVADQRAFSLHVQDFAPLAGIDLKATLVEPGGLDRLESAGEAIESSLSVAESPVANVVGSREPTREWVPTDGYLLRFSNRVRFAGRTYVQIWVKGGWSSSGARINYQFDDNGSLLKSGARGPICDDWG